MYLVITNISKKPNVRALLNTAVAFGCAGVFVVGQKAFDWDASSSDNKDFPRSLKPLISDQRLVIQRFDTWEECVNHLHELSIRLIGVEIHEQARLIEEYCDGQDTAFLMGNEGQGLHAKQMQSCQGFVRIPQYGGGTASLNVYVAASIILHRFHAYQRTCHTRPTITTSMDAA